MIEIKDYNNQLITSVVVTKEAEHEEELMKSDFVKLSWDDVKGDTLPAGAYIVPFEDGVRYTLLEPYTPEQKDRLKFHYEPKFQHPKMYLSKITFKRPSMDSEGNEIVLLDWSYTGFIGTILSYFCEQINNTFNLTGVDAFGYTINTENKVISVSFNTNDILSALTTVANEVKEEWHIDWERKQIYFGSISIEPIDSTLPTLEVGVNVQSPNVKKTNEGYFNAFEPQGSTRNITRRSLSGEYVQSFVRLSLNRADYPDGIIYTDGNGNVVTKADFVESNLPLYLKSVIFDDVYPKMDLYVYDVRYRERYLLDETTKEKIIDHYDSQGEPVYKKYAIWYMRLSYPTYSPLGEVTEWNDYLLEDIREASYKVLYKTEAVSYQLPNYYWYVLDLRDNYDWTWGYEPNIVYNSQQYTVAGTPGAQPYQWDIPEQYRDGMYVCILVGSNSIPVGETITFLNGVPKEAQRVIYSQIIDGKQLIGAFQTNTKQGALTSPLSGRGDGENGYYGFGLRYHETGTIIPASEGDTGVEIKAGDYEIVFQQKEDVILPSTLAQGIVPKGEATPSLNGNIVNLYNLVMDNKYEISAQTELANTTIQHIQDLVKDNSSYTLNSNAVAFNEAKKEALLRNKNYRLYIGQAVMYINGAYSLKTRIMKLVTKLDIDSQQEITVGNTIIKGSTTQLKEDVKTILSGNANGNGNGISESQVKNVVTDWVTPRFLSKTANDTAQGLIGFVKGLWVKAKGLFGIDENGNAKLNNINANNIVVKGLTAQEAHFFNLIIDEVKSAGGQIVICPANAEIVHVVKDDNWRPRPEAAAIPAYILYFKAEDGAGKAITNQFATNDLVLHMEFNVTQAQTKNYWYPVIAGTYSEGREPEEIDLDGDGEDETLCHYIVVRQTGKDGSGVPQAGDDVVCLGNTNNTSRQNAIVLSAYNIPFIDSDGFNGDEGIYAPLFVEYTDVNGYNVGDGNRRNVIARNGTRLRGDFQVWNGSSRSYSSITALIQALSDSITLRVDEISNRDNANLIPQSTFPKKYDEAGLWWNSVGTRARTAAGEQVAAYNMQDDATCEPSTDNQLGACLYAKEIFPSEYIYYDIIAQKTLVTSAGVENLVLEHGAWYTLSWWQKRVSGSYAQCVAYYLHDKAEQIYIDGVASESWKSADYFDPAFDDTDEWVRHTITFKTRAAWESGETVSIEWRLRLLDTTSAQTPTEYWITRVQLEKGMVATEWKPAPEEVVESSRYQTFLEQSSKLINIAARDFNDDGSVKNTSGIMVKAIGSGIYAQKPNGDLALIGVAVEEGGQTVIKLTADNIKLEGLVTANGNVSIDQDGKITAVSGVFNDATINDAVITGQLKGVNGTFKWFDCVDSQGTVVGRICASTSSYNGVGFESVDIVQNGLYNGRSTRLYASNIRCRGSFGAAELNVAMVVNNKIRYYVDGFSKSTIKEMTLQSETIEGHNCYKVYLYGGMEIGVDYGEASGFPVDLLIIKNTAAGYHYKLIASLGKKVTIINANSNYNFAISYIAGYITFNGGEMADMIYIGNNFNPSSSHDGAGWLCGAFRDNNW